jgi:pimeloyl-ACP methyl ester carboxylesterase
VESYFISWRSSTLHYKRFGQGAEWLFCFHGYGEEADSFGMLEPILKDRFTLIALDMPFHGKTNWKEGLSFSTEDLIGIINLINPSQKPFTLLGYSMGGRIALSLTEIIPQLINRAVVVAPDGLHKNKWQWLSTQTHLGNRLFAYCMRRPFWMLRMIQLGRKMGIIDQRMFKFVLHYLTGEEQRAALYRRWTTLGKLRPNPSALQESIIQYQIPVRMLFGKYDNVILTKHGTRFSKNVKDWVIIKEIEAGHQLLKEKHAATIAALFIE